LAKNVEPIENYNDLVIGEHWAIIIGISNYQDFNLNLQFAHRDADDLYNLLIESNGGPFKEDHVKKLINENATFQNIRKALGSFLKRPAKDDLVLIYFSCHGAPDPDRPDNMYILPYDTDPYNLTDTALHMAEIQLSISRYLHSKKIIIIADTCHSAAIGGDIGRRSVKNSSEIINRYFEELAKSKEGTALLTSAEANEVAFEDKRWGNGHGVFTHFLLEGLRGKADGYGGGKRDGIISIGELFEYVRDKVKENTEHKQHPSIGTSRYDRNLPVYFTNYRLESQGDFSSSFSFSSNEDRLEYTLKLLQNGQVNDFNNLRKNDNNNPIYLPNIDLSDKNLSGIDLHGAILLQSIFKKTKMKDANLTGAILTKADLSEADLRSADLSGAKLDGAKLVNIQLRGADLKGMIDFSNADLTGADLREVSLDGIVNFEGAILHNVNFEGSNIDKVDKVLLRLNGADIRNVKSFPSRLEPSNKYSNALKQFSENISDLFNQYNVSVDNKKIVEESIKQLVQDVEPLLSFREMKENKKINIQNKIKNLIQNILNILPMEIKIKIQIIESFTILSTFDDLFDKSKNMTINHIVVDEIESKELSEDSSRRAIIIGINKIQSGSGIPLLKGPENDAIEISDSISYGNFQISIKDFLLGSNATRRNILKALNHVFRNGSDLVLFYFAGYIITDEMNKEVLFAPYDVDEVDPYVTGISTNDLKNIIYRSTNNTKTKVIIVLDCYKIERERDTMDHFQISPYKDTSILYDRLKNIVSSDYKYDQYMFNHGIIILASFESDLISKEKNDCTHDENRSPHTHGAFSYHLIEGLKGKAADSDIGIISIDSLRRYIENQMLAEQKQKPIYYVSGASNIENIKITITKEIFERKISDLIKEIKNLCAIKDKETNFIDLMTVDSAAGKLSELIILDSSNKEIPSLQALIDNALNMYKQSTIEWIINNAMVAGYKINEIESYLYDFKLPNLVNSLSFTELQKMDQSDLFILSYLLLEVQRKTKFKTDNDPKLEIFIAKLRAVFDNFRSPKSSTVIMDLESS
jgi:uncharacterized protein YjbI with pentapeptide repeats/uncharacterized caspase-like protein